jgi:hypothetical protein
VLFNAVSLLVHVQLLALTPLAKVHESVAVIGFCSVGHPCPVHWAKMPGGDALELTGGGHPLAAGWLRMRVSIV